VPDTDGEITHDFRLDEDFVRGAQFKELSAAQRTGGGQDERRKPRRPRPPARDRALPVVVLVLIVLAGGWTLRSVLSGHQGRGSETGPGTSAGQQSARATTSTTFRLSGAPFRPGDCATWDQSAGSGDRSPRIIACDQPHLIEITGRVDLSNRVAFPSDADFETIKNQDCARLSEQFLGSPVDPGGRFQVSTIKPYPSTWAQGGKEVWCGFVATPRNVHDDPFLHPPFTGTVKGQDQTYLWGTGSCLALEAAKIAGAVPCDQPHAYEVAGHVDASVFRTGPPAADPSAWNSRLGAACNTVAKAYASTPFPAGVQVAVLPFPAESWAAGRRTAECVLARPDAAGQPTTLLAALRRPA